MIRRRFLRAVDLALALLVLLPASALAQSAIAGVVKDTSGGVMPGVTVEASSPVLIEKTRTVVTDDQGAYKIIDLRPGVYSVTFTLSGFSVVRREGLELTDAFTATINADLRPGAVEETITVTGQAPLVDVQNVTQRTVLSNAVTESLPSSRLVQGYVTYLPGVTGTTLGVVGLDTRAIQIHGGRTGEFIIAIDGYSTDFASGLSGISSSFFVNQAIVQETNVQTAGAGADQQFEGVWSNVIPKEGSNSFSGYFYGSYSNEHMQADNLTDELKNNGLTAINHNLKLFDMNPAGGGPIIKDKLWFYSAARNSLIDRLRAGVYYNLTPLGFAYTPDLTRQAHSAIRDYDYNLRLTLQASPRNKIILYWDQQPHYVDHRNSDGNQSSTYSPEATNYTQYWPNIFYNATWKSPVSNRLLLEAGANAYYMGINRQPSREPGYNGVDPWSIVAILDSTNNICFRNSNCGDTWNTPISHAVSGRSSAAYITGSHAFKGGMDFRYSHAGSLSGAMDYFYTFRNGLPSAITQRALPDISDSKGLEFGFYVQDQWTTKKVTLNLGMRIDKLNGWIDAVDLPAGRFVPARHYAEVKNVPNYKDFDPRIGVSYDIFGDGKTALKFAMGRYVVGGGNGISGANAPQGLTVASVTRTWNDTNLDKNPDCNLNNPLANGECTQVSDLNFGNPDPRNVGYDPAILTGWGERPYNWNFSLQVQREITSAVSANVGYFRRWYGNFTTTDNLAVVPGDYSTYCVTVPTNSFLPNSGEQICGLSDANTAAKASAVQNQIVRSTDRSETWHGVDATLSLRLPAGASLNGGMSTGRSHTVDCAGLDFPGGGTSATTPAAFCDTTQPFQTQFKFQGRYPLPWWGLEMSGVLQNVPGTFLTATALYTSNQTTLGRLFAGGSATTTKTVTVLQANTVNLKRQTQVDLRFSKNIRYQRYRMTASADLFNLFNSSNVQRFNNRINATYPTPQDIQPARSVGLNVQVTF